MNTPMKADVILAHQRARRNHKKVQRAAGFRHAANVLRQNMPTATIQRETVELLITRLTLDAYTIERDANGE